MPEVILKAADDKLKRSRDGGKVRTYIIDFEPLRQVIGVKLDNDKPAHVLYGPEDMKGDDDTVARLTTFLAQARNWVEDYNEDEAGDTKYRVETSTYPLKKDGVQTKGVVENGKVIESDADDASPLFKIKVSVVPLTERDIKRREKMQKVRAEKAAKNKSGESQGESDGQASGQTEAKTDAATKTQPESTKTATKVSK